MSAQEQLSLALVADVELDALAQKAPAPPRADENPLHVYLAGLAPGSRPTMQTCLQTIADSIAPGVCADAFPWQRLRFAHTQAIRASLAERFAPATCNKYLAALRGVLKAAWRLELIDADSYHRAADVADVEGLALPAGRALSAGELRALFSACAADASPAGARDAALLAILYGGGLRRAEAIALSIADYDRDDRALRVFGKRRKQRLAYLDAGAVSAIDAWLACRAAFAGVATAALAGPLLCPVLKGGRIVCRPMSPGAVLKRLRYRAAQAKVSDLSPHDLRRSFVSDLLDAGVDIATVQKMAGHAHVQTTARYDRRPEDAKRAAAQRLHVPFVDLAPDPGRDAGPGEPAADRDR